MCLVHSKFMNRLKKVKKKSRTRQFLRKKERIIRRRRKCCIQCPPKREEQPLDQELETFSGIKRKLDQNIREKKQGEDRIKTLTEENELLTKKVANYEKFLEENNVQEPENNSINISTQNQQFVVDSKKFSNITFSRGNKKK